MAKRYVAKAARAFAAACDSLPENTVLDPALTIAYGTAVLFVFAAAPVNGRRPLGPESSGNSHAALRGIDTKTPTSQDKEKKTCLQS
mgnify:CR=1 FL=1